jgi:uncharacterized protein with HEPN domain
MIIADLALVHEARDYARHLSRYQAIETTTLRMDMTARNDIQFSIVMISEILKDVSPGALGLARDLEVAAIRGMRNRIIHRRHDVKLEFVRDVVRNRVPPLMAALASLEQRLHAADV